MTKLSETVQLSDVDSLRQALVDRIESAEPELVIGLYAAAEGIVQALNVQQALNRDAGFDAEADERDFGHLQPMSQEQLNESLLKGIAEAERGEGTSWAVLRQEFGL